MVPALLSLLVLTLFLSIGHAERPKSKQTRSEFAHGMTKFTDAWDEHVQVVNKKAHEGVLEGLQKSCKPKRVPHLVDNYQGVAVLFHGFSACPDQWDQMGRLLAEAGYEVLLPMHPGHGNLPLDNNKDVPVTTSEWTDFVKEINEVVRLAPRWTQTPKDNEARKAVHAVGGISVGAVLATYAGAGTFAGTETCPDTGTCPDPMPTALDVDKFAEPLYGRQLIMNAFFAPRWFTKYPLRAAPKDFWIGWGKTCDVEREFGKGGFCRFQVKNIDAAARLGKETLRGVEKQMEVFSAGGFTPRISIIYSKGDLAVDNSRSKKLTLKYPTRFDVFSCGMPFNYHSMISPHDFQFRGENKWWTQPVTCQAVRFLTRGDFFDTESSEGGKQLCDLKCRDPRLEDLKKPACPDFIFEWVEGAVEPKIPQLKCDPTLQ